MILGFVGWFGEGAAETLAGCAAIGLAGWAGLALAARDTGAPALQPVRVRARRR